MKYANYYLDKRNSAQSLFIASDKLFNNQPIVVANKMSDVGAGQSVDMRERTHAISERCDSVGVAKFA